MNTRSAKIFFLWITCRQLFGQSHEALLESIRGDYYRDVNRRVYADALEEKNGSNVRSELINIDLANERNHPERDEYLKRRAQIIADNWREVALPHISAEGFDVIDFDFERGLPIFRNYLRPGETDGSILLQRLKRAIGSPQSPVVGVEIATPLDAASISALEKVKHFKIRADYPTDLPRGANARTLNDFFDSKVIRSSVQSIALKVGISNEFGGSSNWKLWNL